MTTTTSTTVPEPETQPPSPPPPPADDAVDDFVRDLLSDAGAKFTAAEDALRQGRLDLYQRRIEEAQELIGQALEYLN